MKYLAAIELEQGPARAVLEKATSLCGDADQLEVLHVVDPSSLAYSIDPTMTGQIYRQLYEQAISRAQVRLGEVCAEFGIAVDAQHIGYGRVAEQVHSMVRDGGFDECMVGSHGRSGWQRILGSKASSILHGTPVNTWVFRLVDLAPTADPQ